MTTEPPDTHSSAHAPVPLALKSNEGLGVTVGDAVMLRADLYEGPDDCHPGGYLAKKGEKLIVRKVKTDYALPWSDPLCVNVSHEDRTDGLTFAVRQSEIEPWRVTPNE
jgi:hypothetical protein